MTANASDEPNEDERDDDVLFCHDDVLFCTDTFWDRHEDDVRRIAPTIEPVLLSGDDVVAEADLARITVCYFSHDAWPDRTPAFFRAAISAPNLRWLHTMSAGVDSPVFHGFLDRGVRLSNSSGASARPIARSVMMYLLALTRDLPRSLRAQMNREWDWRQWDEVEGRSVAVVGFGPIGQEVVRLADAFAMNPIAIRRSVRGDEPCPTRTLDELAEVAAEVDFLVLAIPLTDLTEGMISAELIAGMRPSAYIVNVGRGELIDQEALIDALDEGRLGGAALDVMYPEPLPSDHRLWDTPRLILTPHNSGSTNQTGARATERFLANLEAWVAGAPLPDEVTR